MLTTNYQGLFNYGTGRGWLGNCRLVSRNPDSEGSGLMMWEFVDTRYDKPRIDGFTIDDTGKVTLRRNIEQWLITNELSSNVEGNYDAEFYQKYIESAYIYISQLTCQFYRYYDMHLDLERLVYDPDRGISIKLSIPRRHAKISNGVVKAL
jgi:hypothetical protein